MVRQTLYLCEKLSIILPWQVLPSGGGDSAVKGGSWQIEFYFFILRNIQKVKMQGSAFGEAY